MARGVTIGATTTKRKVSGFSPNLLIFLVGSARLEPVFIALQKRLQSYETKAQEAEKILHEDADIPEASVFSFKPALEKARSIISMQKQALTTKQMLADRAEYFEGETKASRAKVKALEAEKKQHEQQAAGTINTLKAQVHKLQNEMSEFQQFMSQTSIILLHSKFRHEQRVEPERREREAQEQEREQRQQEALERQQAEERERASQSRQSSAFRGMRPGR